MNVFELVAKLGLDTSEYDKGLDKAGKSGKSFGSKFGSLFKGAGKVAAGGIAVASAAVGALTKSAVDSYADYEQLVGGVETLFGTGGQNIREYAENVGKSVSDVAGEYKSHQRAQEQMLANADNAYKTAGMSANDYMETATSFAASLISSLGGDTEKAAQYADRAVIQMSDNANKMGSDIETIQNAYQGFAKQNYTMLDNLKLGYGGTKTEMERLITDAEALDSSFKATRDSNGDLAMSYSDIVDAIQIVQDNMGITGTTAKEAEQTISGSLSMVKSSWENLLTAMASGNGFQEQMDALVSSAESALNNILPVVMNFLTGFGDLMKQVGPIIVEKLPEIIEEVVPSLLDAAVSIVGSLAAALPGILQAIVEVIGGLVDTISNYLHENFPAAAEVFDSFVEAVKTAFSAIVDLWEGTLKPAFDTLKSFVQTKLWPAIRDAWENVKTKTSAVFEAIKGFWESTLRPALESLKTFVQNTLWPAIRDAWENFKTTTSTVFEAVKSFWDNTLKPAFEAIKAFVQTQLWPAIRDAWENVRTTTGTVFEAVKAFWENTLKPAFEAIKTFVQNQLWPAVRDAWENIRTTTSTVFEAVKSFWENTLRPAFEAIKAFVQTQLWPAIRDAWENIRTTTSTVFEAVNGFWENTLRPAFEAIKSFVQTQLWPAIRDAWENISTTTSTVFNAVKGFWENTLKPAFEAIKAFVQNQLWPAIRDAWENVRSTTSNVFNAVKGFWDNTLQPVFSAIKTYVQNTLWPAIRDTWDNVKTTTSSLFSAIEGFWNGTLKPVFDGIGDAFSSVKSWAYDAWNYIKNSISWDSLTNIFDGFVSGIKDAIGWVGNLINKVKEFLGYNGKTVTIGYGGGGGGNDRTKIKYQMKASAMDTGYIYRHPTVFGYYNGKAQIAGDVGAEAVVGVYSLDKMIQNSVNAAVGRTQAAMVGVLSEILDKMPKGQLVLDTGALVGGIAPEMNNELERITAWSGGGRA